MGSSFTEYRGRGFWSRDAGIELWLYLLACEVKQLQASGEPPRLMLNKHCQVCEFRQRCYTQAEKEDNLSLLRGMSEQEISRQNSKGGLLPKNWST